MSETFKTRAELIYQVLDNLGVLVIGQAPSDEMVSRVDGLLDAVLASLAAREIVYVADAGQPSPPSGGQIDMSIFLPLADMVALRCAPQFNLGMDPDIIATAQRAEEELRVIGRPARTRRYLRTDLQLRIGNRRYAPFNYTTGQ